MPKSKKEIDRRPILDALRSLYDKMGVTCFSDQETLEHCREEERSELGALIEDLELAERGGKPLLKKQQLPKEDYRYLITHYFITYEQNTGARPVMDSRTGKAAKDLLKAMPLSEAKEAIDMAWEDPFFAEKIKQLSHIALNMNKYRRAVEAKPQVLHPVQSSDKHVREPSQLAEVIDISKRLGLD